VVKDISQNGILRRPAPIVLSLFVFTYLAFAPLSFAQEKGSGLHIGGAKKKVHGDLFSVSFPNEKDGWACGRYGTILHTSDGGVNWQEQDSGTEFTLTSVCFIDAHNGWTVGSQGTIIHTTDGGKTWKKQESPVDYYHMEVYFAAPLKGWIVSERTHILSTDDGGKTWSVQFQDLDYILKSISFTDELNGWAVGEYGFIYHTSDGGATWEWQGGSCYIDEETGELCGEQFLYDVVALDPQRAMAVGIDGFTITTEDGGKTWTKLDAKIPQAHLFCICSDGKGTIVIGGDGLCAVSVDNGLMWEKAEFKPHIDYSWIYGLAHLGDSHFTACGDEGAIYRSASSKIWEKVYY
jgi:photosystem II stability/assembly factor-like uncharacterized protein